MAVRATSRIPQLQRRFHTGVQRQLKRGAKEYRLRARELAPEWSGDLKESIRLGSIARTPNGYLLIVFTDSDYAAFQEFGTGEHATAWTGRKTPWVYLHPEFGWITTTGNPAQPYMRPAYEQTLPEVKAIMRDVL